MYYADYVYVTKFILKTVNGKFKDPCRSLIFC